jgi:divalent metal cation (Fe/Co/Zn/Cd) transporter
MDQANVMVDAHLEVDATITVEAGHDIAVDARRRVLQHHRVLNLMTHMDPSRRPDLDHFEVTGLFVGSMDGGKV